MSKHDCESKNHYHPRILTTIQKVGSSRISFSLFLLIRFWILVRNVNIFPLLQLYQVLSNVCHDKIWFGSIISKIMLKESKFVQKKKLKFDKAISWTAWIKDRGQKRPSFTPLSCLLASFHKFYHCTAAIKTSSKQWSRPRARNKSCERIVNFKVWKSLFPDCCPFKPE